MRFFNTSLCLCLKSKECRLVLLVLVTLRCFMFQIKGMPPCTTSFDNTSLCLCLKSKKCRYVLQWKCSLNKYITILSPFLTDIRQIGYASWQIHEIFLHCLFSNFALILSFSCIFSLIVELFSEISYPLFINTPAFSQNE